MRVAFCNGNGSVRATSLRQRNNGNRNNNCSRSLSGSLTHLSSSLAGNSLSEFMRVTSGSSSSSNCSRKSALCERVIKSTHELKSASCSPLSRWTGTLLIYLVFNTLRNCHLTVARATTNVCHYYSFSIMISPCSIDLELSTTTCCETAQASLPQTGNNLSH